MIEHTKLKLLKTHPSLKEFLENTTEFEIIFKILNLNEITRIDNEYPEFELSKYIRSKETKIFTITFIKNDIDPINFQKIKKIKIYFNESNGKIIKILQN